MLHKKLPSNDNPQKRDCVMVLVCMLCMEAQEITSHTFLQYNFVVDIWNWLGDLFEIIIFTVLIVFLFFIALEILGVCISKT